MREIIKNDPGGFMVRVLDRGEVEVSLWTSGLWPDRYPSAIDALEHFEAEAKKTDFISSKEEDIMKELRKLIKHNYSEYLPKKKKIATAKDEIQKPINSFFPEIAL